MAASAASASSPSIYFSQPASKAFDASSTLIVKLFTNVINHPSNPKVRTPSLRNRGGTAISVSSGGLDCQVDRRGEE